MAASTAFPSVADVESFIDEYFGAWQGTDEDRIMSYYAEDVTVLIPGALLQGRAAVREQFVRPFITGFPGNRHIVKNWIFGRDVVVVEWSFEAQHKGTFEGRAATNARVEVPGCGVYEYDSVKRQITSARIYMDRAALLKQILNQRRGYANSEATDPVPAETMGASVDLLDLATVIAVSQTVSGEVVLEKLLDTLMRAAIEEAGATRALLILSRADQRVAAEAIHQDRLVTVRLCDESVTGSQLPVTILRHVTHARENVILDDAAGPNPFSTDPYIAERHPRSLFCLPLMSQAKFIGVLYLENNVSLRAFAPARTVVLKLLASQAAISIENSRLYADLAERESRIRRLVDANIIGIFIWALGGSILEANDAFLRMVGYDREYLVANGLNWKDLTPPEWRERDEQQLKTELETCGTVQPFEKEYFRKDGSRVSVLIGVAAFEKSATQGVAYVLDLTERKRAEQALREREHEADLILETIPGLAAILTPKGEVAAVNHELAEYCGQALEAMKQWGTNGTVHPEDLPRIVPMFSQAISSGHPYDFEARIRRFDASYHWCQIRGLPLRDTEDCVVRWYVVLSDIDNRRRAEEAIEEVRAELAHVARVTTMSALTASVAHEVNQPLAGIVTNASTCLRMLDAAPPDVDGARETARRTIRDGNRASAVIARLRALFSKRESTFEPLDLNEAVREVLVLSSNDLRRNHIVVATELADDLPTVIGDRIQLQQVILNLVRNASDAMANVSNRPRQLSLGTGRDGSGHVQVTVRDAGVGIPQQGLDLLFQAFHTTKSGGMGIGLYVSRSIIDKHNGRLWAEPNRGTPGATFSFTIPCDTGCGHDALSTALA